MRHYCLDEAGDETWTARRLSDRDRPFVVCAVCDRPREETILERDAMRRRLRALAANLAIAGALERARLLGEHAVAVYIGSEYASGPIEDPWRPGCGKEAP